MITNEKIKVLFVGPLPPPVHGISMINESIVNSDLRDRFHSKVLDIADRTPKANRTIGMFSISNAVQGILQSLHMFAKLVTFRPDCVFLYLSQGKWGFLRDSILIRLARFFSAKVVANLGGSNFRNFYDGRPRREQKRMLRILNYISIIEVLGENLRDLFNGLVPKERVSVVPNGIKLESLIAISRKRVKRSPSHNILNLGSLSVAKGILELIDAFNIIAAEYSDAYLILAGPWKTKDDENRILSRIGESPFRDRIELTGLLHGKSKMAVFERADLFMQLSHNEGQSVALIEAISTGLPAICTRRGANSDVVVDGKGGYVVDSHDPGLIAKSMVKILTDENTYRRFSAFNVSYARERFSHEVFIKNVERDIRCAVGM